MVDDGWITRRWISQKRYRQKHGYTGIRRYSVETAKHIIKVFIPSGSQTILVFQHQTEWQYSDGDPPNGGVECKRVWKITIFDQYLALPRKSCNIEPYLLWKTNSTVSLCVTNFIRCMRKGIDVSWHADNKYQKNRYAFASVAVLEFSFLGGHWGGDTFIWGGAHN